MTATSMTNAAGSPITIRRTTREAWLRERAKGLGASDAPIVLGQSPWCDPLMLYLRKRGMAPELEESEAMRWGNILEPIVAREFRSATGRKVVNPGGSAGKVIFVSERHPFALATLDRIQHDEHKPGPGVLELKTTSGFRADDWDDQPPLHYQIQVQHQLAVTGFQWGSLAVLIGGNKFRWFDVARNDRFIDAMLAKEAAFWHHVQAGQPPEPDGSASSAKALELLYPTDDGETVALPPEAVEWDRRIEEIRTQAKALEEEERALKDRIKAAIGGASYGALPGGGRYSWKTIERAAHEVKASSFRQLKRVK